MVGIQVYADFTCPYCFLAEFALKQATTGKAVRIEWMPFELRPAPAPTLRMDSDFVQKAWRNSVAPLAHQLGVDIRLPTLAEFPHSRLAFEGLEFAKDRGKADEYYARVMGAMFQESKDIGDTAVLTHLASEIQLPEIQFREALESGQYSQRVETLLKHAYGEMRITGVPFFVIGGRSLTGLQTPDTLAAAIEASRASTAARPSS